MSAASTMGKHSERNSGPKSSEYLAVMTVMIETRSWSRTNTPNPNLCAYACLWCLPYNCPRIEVLTDELGNVSDVNTGQVIRSQLRTQIERPEMLHERNYLNVLFCQARREHV